jgi:hypothetical protein
VIATAFYGRLTAAMALPPEERHQQLVCLHDQALRTYQTVLNRLTPESVNHPLPNHPDQRTIAQIIGHIAA